MCQKKTCGARAIEYWPEILKGRLNASTSNAKGCLDTTLKAHGKNIDRLLFLMTSFNTTPPSPLYLISLFPLLCHAFFTFPSAMYCSYLCLGDIIAGGWGWGGGGKCWVTDWPADMGTGIQAQTWIASHADSLVGRLVAIKCLKREREAISHGDGRGSWQTWRVGGLFLQKRGRQNGSGYQEVRHLRHGADMLSQSDLQ